MTTILHLETATRTCSVALSVNSKLVDTIEIHSDQYIHGEKLTPFIQDLLSKNSITFDTLSAVSISSGPGSYTGLRIGVATAKGICFAKNIPLIEIDTIQAFENCARGFYPKENLCIMLDARRMEVYSTIFDSKRIPIKELSADIITEQTYSEFEPFICIGDGADKCQNIWRERNIIFNNTIQLSASGQVELAFNKFLNNQFADLAYYEPNYLKEFYSGK
jgi:tRNA threonylcarbamoyladenosine biosynthesis protein TsaB